MEYLIPVVYVAIVVAIEHEIAEAGVEVPIVPAAIADAVRATVDAVATIEITWGAVAIGIARAIGAIRGSAGTNRKSGRAEDECGNDTHDVFLFSRVGGADPIAGGMVSSEMKLIMDRP